MSSQDEPGGELDVDAAFAEIVARWGPTAEEPARQQPVTPPEEPPAGPASRSLHELFRPAFPEPPAEPPVVHRDGPPLGHRQHGDAEAPTDATAWEDEGHFVPPPPPPLPVVEPRRRLAWAGLAGAPVVAILFLLLRVTPPGWFSLGLVAAFVGGFAYLVATMGSGEERTGDGWSGDDGARL